MDEEPIGFNFVDENIEDQENSVVIHEKHVILLKKGSTKKFRLPFRLSLPPTSVESERTFSRMGLIYVSNRSSLDRELAKKQLFYIITSIQLQFDA